MTDEERQILCTKLRDGSPKNMPKWAYEACSEAADEIEQLAERLQAIHGYASECETKTEMLLDQIDNMLVANKNLRNKLLEYVAERNAEFFFDSFPEKRTDWMKDD